jgi:excisionase family DNA binding protein
MELTTRVIEPMPEQGVGDSDQAAAYLKVSTITLKRWRYRGTGPRHVLCGSQIRYRKADLDEWLEANASPART